MLWTFTGKHKHTGTMMLSYQLNIFLICICLIRSNGQYDLEGERRQCHIFVEIWVEGEG